jgi:hypothetical protein
MANVDKNAGEALVDNVSLNSDFGNTKFWKDLRDHPPSKKFLVSDDMVMLRHLKDQVGPLAAAEGKAARLAGLLEGHGNKLMGKLEEQLHWESLGKMEKFNWYKGQAAEYSGVNAVKNAAKKGGKAILIGTALVGGGALALGLFGGKKKESEEAQETPPQQTTMLPTPEMMMATAPQSSMGIMPNGNMPGSQVDIAQIMGNRPQLAMGA